MVDYEQLMKERSEELAQNGRFPHSEKFTMEDVSMETLSKEGITYNHLKIIIRVKNAAREIKRMGAMIQGDPEYASLNQKNEAVETLLTVEHLHQIRVGQQKALRKIRHHRYTATTS